MKRFALICISMTFAVPAVPAQAHYYAGCKKGKCMRHVIKPFIGPFLGPTGACESGRGKSLKSGLRAISPTGQYRGRYQFGMPDWRRSGGQGDPINATWFRQAYQAVKWLHINGRQSWPNC